jgi:hypothetical protein
VSSAEGAEGVENGDGRNWVEEGRLCPAAYDEPKVGGEESLGQQVEAHACDRTEGHEGLHHCELCGKNWLARVGVKERSGEDRDQVAQARQDAVKGRVGFVMISYEVVEDDQHFVYQRIDPDRVVVSQKGGQ